MSSFSEIQQRLRSTSLRDLLVLAGGGVNGLGFNEVAALRERFLDLAFDSEDLTIDERSLACVWARAIDSVLVLMLEQQSNALASYLRAREASRDEKVRFGFGSAGYLASGRGADVPADQLRGMHTSLLFIAFGPSSSASAA